MLPLPLRDPEFLPYEVDLQGDRVLMLRMSDAQRRAAAFLDRRGIPANAEGIWVPRATLGPPPGVAAQAPAWIFHIGHCGSTLLSRLLEAWPGNQVLREPLPLRALAAALAQGGEAGRPVPQWLGQLVPWWNRPLPPRMRTVIKATSSCNALIESVLGATPGSRLLLLDMPLQPYLATLVKSPDSVRDALAAAPERWRVLQQATGASLPGRPPQSPAEVCAMGWLAEQARFGSLAGSGAALRIDFHAFLARPEETLERIRAHLSLDETGLADALRSPWWGRYSKADGHAYDARDRKHDLELSMQRHADEIRAGIEWAGRFAAAWPALAPAS